MKKSIALIVALCMLVMAMPASAAGAAAVQDELPPALVSVKEEADTVEMKDVHQRAEADPRLAAAYEGVMAGVHFSDVASLTSDVLKTDINAALADQGLTAYDLVMYELFDAVIDPEKGADEAVEFVVQLKQEQPMPLLVIFTPDGTNWKLLENWSSGSNRCVTLTLTESGAVGFLYNGIGDQVEDEQPQPEETPSEEEDSPFTPSVAGKPAPSVVPTQSEGEAYVATILKKPDTLVAAIPEGPYLVVTPVAERDDVMDIMTHEHLAWAYDGILEAKVVKNLQEGVCEEVDALLTADGFDLTCDDLVVRDLFEVSVYGEYLEYFYAEDHYLKVSFDASVDPNEALVVLCSPDSVNWTVLPSENVMVHESGAVTLHLEKLGAVAFLVERADAQPAMVVSSPE